VVSQMSEQLSSFVEFYKKKHANRVLNWDHALGNAAVVGNFKGGKKELLVSLYQAIVLLQFNENTGGIGYSEIKMATRMRECHSVSLSVFKATATD
jgi:cullin-4